MKSLYFSSFILLVILSSNDYSIKCSIDFAYHNHASYSQILITFANNYPYKTFLYSIGKSVEGRDLWVLAIADTHPNVHIALRPEAKYVGNMHGNEVASKEILLHLVDHLLADQATDPDVDFLLKNTRIHIMPSMNPDGYELTTEGQCNGLGRGNGNNKDLNRNFPELFSCNEANREPETKAVMDWLKNNDFILSANFHGGAVVANYPYDNSPKGYSVESLTNDNDMFKSMALTYSQNHLTMTGPNCGYQFENGVTNGAKWYAVPGGMQDYNYWAYGCYELTIELTCCKFPPASELPQIWMDNKKSLVEFLKKANTGVRGILFYSNGQPAENVTVKIGSREPYFRTNKNGEFYRILLDGTYEIQFMYNCDIVHSIPVVVSGLNEMLNVTLPEKVSNMASNYSLSRFPLYCAQKITRCVSYNSDYPRFNIGIVIGEDEGGPFNGLNMVKVVKGNLIVSLMIFMTYYIYC